MSEKKLKANYYFDEAGDPQILGHHGVNLIKKGTASKVFMVGFLETSSPKEFTRALNNLRAELTNDEYLKEIPSFHHSLEMFHANKDCSEVREKVYKLLKQQDFSYYCIVARKNEDLFRKKFNMSQKSLYKYLVAKLLENRLHFIRTSTYISAQWEVSSARHQCNKRWIRQFLLLTRRIKHQIQVISVCSFNSHRRYRCYRLPIMFFGQFSVLMSGEIFVTIIF